MENCLFCKILGGEIESDFIYEDQYCKAFRDINPKAETHFLIVPTKHIDSVATLEENDDKIMGHLIMVAKLLAEKYNLKGYKLQFNVGKEGGQEIFHIHLHLMSKFSS